MSGLRVMRLVGHLSYLAESYCGYEDFNFVVERIDNPDTGLVIDTSNERVSGVYTFAGT